MGEMEKYPVSIYRGGTSKALIFRREDLPDDARQRDCVILCAFGSPDKRQIDGMGGADSLTSKVAIVGLSERTDADVDYTFGQVSITDAKIDYTGNCGNISSAIGPYVVNSRLVPAVEPITTVRIFNTNTKKIIEAEVPVLNGCARVEGETLIDGVPGEGAPILLNFLESAGAVTGKLLPSGVSSEQVKTERGVHKVSFVDSANPVIFVAAEDFGLNGTEDPSQINGDLSVKDELEEIRGIFAVRMGLADGWREAKQKSPSIPKICMVAPAGEYWSITGRHIRSEDVDVNARMMSMQRTHQAFAVTAAVCLGTAAKIPGTVVYDMISPESRKTGFVRIGHPSGSLTVSVEITEDLGHIRLDKAAVVRTARRIMDGEVYISRKKVERMQLI